MATNFPSSLDNFTNPVSGNTLDSPSHSLQHSDANDAIEAIEAKLGVGASPAGSATAGQVLTISTAGTSGWSTPDYSGAWTSYTPTLTNVTVGNGILVAYYKQIGKLVEVYIDLLFGSTTSFSGNPKIGYPVTARSTGNDQFTGVGSLSDAGIATYFITLGQETTTYSALYAVKSDGAYTTITSVTATVPFTISTNDRVRVQFKYEAA